MAASTTRGLGHHRLRPSPDVPAAGTSVTCPLVASRQRWQPGLKLKLDRHREPSRRTTVQAQVDPASLRRKKLQRLQHGSDVPPLAMSADIGGESAVEVQAPLLVVRDKADRQILIRPQKPHARPPPTLAPLHMAPRDRASGRAGSPANPADGADGLLGGHLMIAGPVDSRPHRAPGWRSPAWCPGSAKMSREQTRFQGRRSRVRPSWSSARTVRPPGRAGRTGSRAVLRPRLPGQVSGPLGPNRCRCRARSSPSATWRSDWNARR